MIQSAARKRLSAPFLRKMLDRWDFTVWADANLASNLAVRGSCADNRLDLRFPDCEVASLHGQRKYLLESPGDVMSAS